MKFPKEALDRIAKNEDLALDDMSDIVQYCEDANIELQSQTKMIAALSTQCNINQAIRIGIAKLLKD